MVSKHTLTILMNSSPLMTLLSDLAVAQADRDKAWAAYLRSAEKAHFTANSLGGPLMGHRGLLWPRAGSQYRWPQGSGR